MQCNTMDPAEQGRSGVLHAMGGGRTEMHTRVGQGSKWVQLPFGFRRVGIRNGEEGGRDQTLLEAIRRE